MRLAIGRPRRASLVQRLFRLTAIPAAAGAVLLVAYLTQRQVGEIESLLRENAHSLSAQTAMLASEPLARVNRPELARIATSLLLLPNVERVRMIGGDGEVLATAGDLVSARAEDLVTATNAAMGPVGTRPPAAGTAMVGQVEIGMSSAPLASARHRARVAGGVALLATLALCSLMSWWVARSVGAPIKQLAEAVDRLGHGDLHLRVPVSERGEIGTLQKGFNVTAASLANAQQSMQAEIEQATAALAEKNHELEAANLSKSRFLAAASHDLRQPLHALTLFSAGLEHGEHDPARRERIARIQECVGSLDRLFTELLDLSRLDSGALKLAPVRFPLDKLFQEISQTFRPIAEDRELRLVLRKTGLWVDADRAMLSQVLNNLVSNAIRYTREGGVLVGARRRGSQVRIDVWDTGIGIAPEHQAQVFDEFFQVSTGSQRASRGLGLGLATVKRLCQVMQVPIQLRSHPGRGTVFNLLLPGSAPVPSEPVAPPAGASVDLAGLPVIVIDDERAILDGIEWLMKSWGCDVRCAETIEQARALLAAGSAAPELLISDLRLREGHNGIEAIRQLRQDSRTCFGQEPAALLVTGETSPDRLREIAGAGVPVLHKPVLPERLREAVASTLAARRAAVT